MTLRFIKLSNRWFIDIPWIGDINDLQMVDGAHDLLDEWAQGDIVTHLTISTPKTKGLNKPIRNPQHGVRSSGVER